MITCSPIQPDSLAYHVDRMDAFSSINDLKADFSQMEKNKQAASHIFDIQAAEDIAALAIEDWDNSVCSHTCLSTVWDILWAQKDEFMFVLIEHLLKNVSRQEMKFCDKGRLCLDPACGLNIAQSRDATFELRTQCIWNAVGEEDVLLSGSFLEVLEKAKAIINAANGPAN